MKGFDEVILVTDADFRSSGLKTASLARLGFLAVVPQSKVIGTIGSLSGERHKRLLKTLSDYLVA